MLAIEEFHLKVKGGVSKSNFVKTSPFFSIFNVKNFAVAPKRHGSVQ